MTASPADYDSFLALCQARKSVRKFLPDALSDEQIEKIRAAALTSPFAAGKKNWSLVVVSDRATIAQMSEAVKAKTAAIAETAREDYKSGFLRYAENFHIFADAPTVFVPTFRVQPSLSIIMGEQGGEIGAYERENFAKSISCVAMLVLLAAKSLGLGSCYMTGPLLAGEELMKIVRVPRGHEIGAIIPVGYEDDGR